MSDPERHLLNLPVRYGGMGLTNPSIFSDFQYQSSIKITFPLVDLILMQASSLPTNLNWVQHEIKKDVIKSKRQFLDNMSKEATINSSEKQRRLMEIASEKGASSWLTVLPIQEHGYHLHKGSFRDALCMRYGWQPPLLPTTCVCHKAFSVEHCLSCPNGGYTIFRHNELRDVTAQLLAETCHNVTTEPSLQPMSGETLKLKSANREDGAQLDVAATNVWEHNGQRSFFDIRVFNPLAATHVNASLKKCYTSQEGEKRRVYEQRIREVEHGSFSPLVFNTLGGFGPLATVVYKRIASQISDKRNLPYSIVRRWVRCRIAFSLLRSTIMMLRSTHQKTPSLDFSSIPVALAEGRMT